MSENSLAIFTKASQMLAEADTIQKAKELKSLALTAADWAKRKGMGEEAVQHARSYALEAERKMGQMLINTDRAKGGQPYQKSTRSHREPVDQTLAEFNLTRKESHLAKKLAELPKEKFEQIKTGEKTRTEVRRELQRDSIKRKVQPMPNDKFRVLYADPPWKYGDGMTQDYGAAKHHYPCMTISELCALPISSLTQENSVLFLWVTSPLLSECWPVIKSWGFTYKASFVWDKVKHNMGHYNSVRHEFLLLCTRGSCLPDTQKLIDSVQSIERSGKHSQKPEEFREIIERLYPHGKRLELFAREKHDGWNTWGNE